MQSNVKVLAPKERKYSTFIGGSILAGFLESSLKDNWITKSEFEETGPQIVH